jgi:hypothetical protein
MTSSERIPMGVGVACPRLMSFPSSLTHGYAAFVDQCNPGSIVRGVSMYVLSINATHA